jgi:hypothetical protein
MLLFKSAFKLEEHDIRTTVGYENGADFVLITDKARKRIGLSVECKDRKSLGIFAALEQAKKNLYPGTVEAVVFKNGAPGLPGQHKTYITVPLDHYLGIRRRLNAAKRKIKKLSNKLAS